MKITFITQNGTFYTIAENFIFTNNTSLKFIHVRWRMLMWIS